MGVRVRQKIKGKGNPWWVFVSHNGKRTSRKVGSKRAADIVAAKIQAKISLGEFGFMDRKAMPTFREYSEKWLKGYVKLNCRESTVDEYMGALNFHVLPAYKDERLDQITRGSIRNFLLEKHGDGLSRSRVMFLKALMSGISNYALDDELSENLKRGFKDVKELVFQHDGQIMKQFFISDVYKRILKKAGLRYRKFHSLRHSFCANLLSKGVSPYYVSRQVGHSSINIICDTYGSWIRTEDNRHVNLLDSVRPNAPYTHPEGENREKIHVKSSW